MGFPLYLFGWLAMCSSAPGWWVPAVFGTECILDESINLFEGSLLLAPLRCCGWSLTVATITLASTGITTAGAP
jgi:hypothetical protein